MLAALHVHHHLHGPSLGYVGIVLAAAISWAGVPGAGEAALIAGGIYAARGRLDLAELLVLAWLGAATGGMLGWIVGRRAGRAVAVAPGPLRRQRRAAIARGARFFERFGILAVYFAPSWVAGTTGLPARKFVPANALAALIWVALVGLGSYLVGPPIADVVSDVGLVGLIVLGVIAAMATVAAVLRRRRAQAQRGV